MQNKIARYTGILGYSWCLVDTAMVVLVLTLYRYPVIRCIPSLRCTCTAYWYHIHRYH